MTSSENDDVIQTFAPYAAEESLTDRVHQRCLNRCALYLDPSTLRNTIKFSTELAVIIANDELGSFTEWRDVPQLLRCPLRSWGTSNTNVHNASRIDIDDEERKDRSEPDIVGLQEITRPDRMVSQERAPILPAREFRWSGLDHMSLDRAFCDSDAKLEQFAAYSFRSPQDIFGGNALDECDDFRVNPRSACFGILRFPAPEKPKSLSVPTKHRFRLHEQKSIAPMRQKARQQDNQTALIGPENRTFDPPRRDNELLTKQGVLHQ